MTAVPAVGTDLADESGATLTVAATTAIVRLAVPAELASTLVVGTELGCTVGDTPELPCQITRVFDATPDEAGIGTGDQVLTWADVAPREGTIGADQADQPTSVRVLVATLAEDALLVPAIAVAEHASGAGRVLVQRGNAFDLIPVQVLGVLDGTAAISGELEPGDRVRVD